jgi:hypothetical protein
MSDSFSDLHNNPNIITHSETTALSLVSLHESGYLLHTDTQKVTVLGEFCGNPTCGLISHDRQWALMGGEYLIVWHQGVLTEIPLKWIFAIRQTDTDKVHILTDPWDPACAVWELHITTLALQKIKPFTDYLELEYTEEVSW